MRIFRIGAVFNRKGRKGIFDIGHAKGYSDFILTDPADPFITGTDVPRLQPMHLGAKSVGVTEDEIQRVVLALQHFYASKAAQRVSSDKKKTPPQRDVGAADKRAKPNVGMSLTRTPPLNRFAVPEAMPAASVDNRTVGKTTAGLPQPSQKDRDDRPDTKGTPS